MKSRLCDAERSFEIADGDFTESIFKRCQRGGQRVKRWAV